MWSGLGGDAESGQMPNFIYLSYALTGRNIRRLGSQFYHSVACGSLLNSMKMVSTLICMHSKGKQHLIVLFPFDISKSIKYLLPEGCDTGLATVTGAGGNDTELGADIRL